MVDRGLMVELTSVLDDGIVVQGRVPPEEVCVRTLLVPVLCARNSEMLRRTAL
jgi:hypothetical protein